MSRFSNGLVNVISVLVIIEYYICTFQCMFNNCDYWFMPGTSAFPSANGGVTVIKMLHDKKNDHVNATQYFRHQNFGVECFEINTQSCNRKHNRVRVISQCETSRCEIGYFLFGEKNVAQNANREKKL